MAAAYLGGQRPADAALDVALADRFAEDTIRRLRTGEVDSDQLGILLSRSSGVQLKAFARALAKALRGVAG